VGSSLDRSLGINSMSGRQALNVDLLAPRPMSEIVLPSMIVDHLIRRASIPEFEATKDANHFSICRVSSEKLSLSAPAATARAAACVISSGISTQPRTTRPSASCQQ
jgi:hypothetical protein